VPDSAALYERGVGGADPYGVSGAWPWGTVDRRRTHPWEFPDRIRWPQVVLFPRWRRYRANADRWQWRLRYRLASRIVGYDVE
jgi:hypothetical protein